MVSSNSLYIDDTITINKIKIKNGKSNNKPIQAGSRAANYNRLQY